MLGKVTIMPVLVFLLRGDLLNYQSRALQAIAQDCTWRQVSLELFIAHAKWWILAKPLL